MKPGFTDLVKQKEKKLGESNSKRDRELNRKKNHDFDDQAFNKIGNYLSLT